MVHNVHQRVYSVESARLGELLDQVAGTDSPLWPVNHWPPMLFDRPLGVGADGGHGPIRYACTVHEPGRRAEFRFSPGFFARGTHTLEVIDGGVLRHSLRVRLVGIGHVLWPLAIRWLHDALLEDMLDRAGDSLGHPPTARARWSPWVRFLRGLSTRVPALSR